jgi:cytochrome P450/NADPH-cytochrome P450 reductase
MVLKWARYGPDEEIALTEDFSNLTLDTIALCTMDFRFNSFYRGGAHPYVAAMNTILGSAGQGPPIPIVSTLLSMWRGSSGAATKEEKAQAAEFLRKTGQEIIDNRRSRKERKNDFLDMVLYGKDPKTGESMRDDLIQSQMSSFLIAGHETTSGLLSFAVIKLLQNPETYRKAQDEVDRVVGDSSIALQHIRKLKYIYAVLQETLRCVPTAPIISKVPHPDRKDEICVLGGKYKVDHGVKVSALLGKCMEDPKVFGEDAREFKPERMLESNPDYTKIEPYWRPFSEGSRGCLGRGFSLQEAILALALVLQNFDLRLADPMYNMRIKHSITLKPLGLYVKASLRHGTTPVELEQKLHSGSTPSSKGKGTNKKQDDDSHREGATPLTILYGTNTGTCLALAQRLAAEASSSYGFNPEVLDMDAAVGRLSTEYPTIIVTPSYEGEPPDNALQFVQSLEAMEGVSLKGVKFAVFGCGHRDWHATHHRVPRLVDNLMTEHGAERIAEMGLSDVSQGNPIADFETWMDKTLLPSLKKLSPTAHRAGASTTDVEADVSTGDRAALLHQDLQVGTVKDVKVLTTKGEQPEKRHMEVELPAGSTYECGDYLAVLPQSPEQNVRAVMAHFKLPSDATITLKSKSFAPLPLQTSLSVQDILRNYYELAKPTTRRGLSLALKYTSDDNVRKQMSAWLDDDQKFHKDITEAQTSLFDILEKYPQIDMPLASFLACLPPLSIRQYSISSSPLQDPEKCTITYSVLTDEKDAGKPFYGVASNYLASLKPGDRMQVATRRTAKQTFRLPLDAENTPLLMFAAGTGLAPFRGFVEQRSVQLEANPDTKLAPAYLFLGCRHSQRDRLYAELMDKWEKIGAVTVFYSYSQEPDKSEGCKHVADRMMKEIELISGAWMGGARAYVCGHRDFAQSVGKAAKAIVEKRLDARKADGWTEDRIESRKQEIFGSFSERAADDVFD